MWHRSSIDAASELADELKGKLSWNDQGAFVITSNEGIYTVHEENEQLKSSFRDLKNELSECAESIYAVADNMNKTYGPKDVTIDLRAELEKEIAAYQRIRKRSRGQETALQTLEGRLKALKTAEKKKGSSSGSSGK